MSDSAPVPAVSDPTSSFRLDGKVAVVTGASSGIGDRMARVLHAAGASVVVAARRKERLEALAEQLPGTLAVACDVADDGDCQRLIETTLAQHQRVDLLVNNAGIADPMPAEDEPVQRFREILNVNLTGAFLLSQLAARDMLQRGSGTIVNVASVLGIVAAGQIPQSSYTASKAGLINLTREMAVQWARRGVRVNAIAPGWFATEMTAEMFDAESGQTWIRRRTPMGRAGNLDELDGALLFLASPASSYVTGQVIPVDGGWTSV